MAIGKRTSFIIIITLIVAVCALCFLCGTNVKAEQSDSANLSPVVADGGDIVYRCFDMPTAVYADSKGILVGGENIEEISSESEITGRKAVKADKLYRHLEHGDHAEYLIVLYNGVLGAYYGEQPPVTLAIDGDVVDFDIYNDTLYAVTANTLVTAPLGDMSFTQDSVTQSVITSDRHSTIDIQAVSVVAGDVYIAVHSTFRNMSDICLIRDGEISSFLIQSDSIIRLSSYGNSLYALTRGSIVKYHTVGNGILIKQSSVSGERITDIHAYGDAVYALDILNALIKYSSDFSTSEIIMASSSDAVGFFNMPTGLAVKNSKLFVADSMNDRIAVYGHTVEYSHEITDPVSIACDSAGTTYIAYGYNKIGIFTDGDLSTTQRVITDPAFGIIKQIAVDADKTLYMISDGGLWRIADGNTNTELLSDTKFKALTLGIGRDELYVLTDSAVLKLDKQSGEFSNVCGVGNDAISLAVDLSGAVFTLYPDRITLNAPNGDISQFPLELNGESYTLGGKFGAMALCTVDNEFVSYGDIIIVDTYKHRVFTVNGKTLGVKLVDDSYDVPDILEDNSLAKYDGLIRVTLRDADVFSLPMETTPIYTITAGRKVIVPQYEFEDTKEYSLILIDDLDHGKLIQGYVYKDVLSVPLPYVAPPSTIGTVFNAATPIYKWPSRNSVAAKGFSAVNRNTQLKMLDFVETYRDDYGYTWYRVSLDNAYEGYILGVNLSLMSYEPVFIRPAYNAEIISYKGSEYATAYIIEDGEYIEIAKLPTGTQVEVVGAFDSSERYTQVKYLDPELGTLTCYVETVYIKYNGVNIVLIVAVVVIVITVILASIIIVRTARRKKSKIDDEE